MAAERVYTAHVVVEFAGEGDNFTAFVEVDDRDFGFNGGKTNFLPGQDAYLLLFKPTGYSVIFNATTAGVLTKYAETQKEVEEIVQLANEDAASVRYPINSDYAYQWIGTSIGVLARSGEFGVALPARSIDPQTQTPIPEYRIGIARLLYKANCEVWRLSQVPVTVDQVMCFFAVKRDAP